MREFYGKKAKEFFETKGKTRIAMPAVRRRLPVASSGERFLDVGCGTGAFYPLAVGKGYKYYGIDASEDMLQMAAAKYPSGGYIMAGGNRFARIFKGKFDAILISMVFPSISSLSTIIAILSECGKVLKRDKPLFVVVSHPCYDHYMQYGLLKRKNVRANFKGYFASGSKYATQHRSGKRCFVFEDYHWTIDDYLAALKKAGFRLVGMDECQPPEKLKKEDGDFYKRRSIFPTYLLLEANLS